MPRAHNNLGPFGSALSAIVMLSFETIAGLDPVVASARCPATSTKTANAKTEDMNSSRLFTCNIIADAVASARCTTDAIPL